jgi:chromosome segregation ATPase
MAEKKKLLAEIRDLNTETAALDGEIPEMEEKFRQIYAEVEDCRKNGDKAMEDAKATLDSSDWHNQERERLQKEIERLWQESEKHRQEGIKLASVSEEHFQKAKTLLLERDQIQEQGAQVLGHCIQLKNRRDQLETQRATAKKKLEELTQSTI